MYCRAGGGGNSAYERGGDARSGEVWLHFEPKFVTDCKAHKTPAILCIFIEFFMQIDQPTV